MLHIKSATYLDDYKIYLVFNDGTSGEVDLDGRLKGPVFEILKNKEEFARLRVDPILQTITWPNGVDLAPEFLKKCMLSHRSA